MQDVTISGAMAGEDVIVAIPVLNEVDNLPKVVQALLADTEMARALIVVADGGSTDGSREWVQRIAADTPRVILLPNPKRLQSAGVNLVVQRYGGGKRWLVRIDAHGEYPPNFVSNLVRAAEQMQADSVVVPMRTVGVRCFQRAAAAAQNSVLGTGGSPHRSLTASTWVDHGHHALMALSIFQSVGGYDESFAANEDAELDTRLCRADGRVWLAADLPIVYKPRETAKALFRQYMRNGKGRARTYLRYRSRLKLRQMAPLAIAPAILLVAPALYAPILALPAAAWALACLLYGVHLGFRSNDRCAVASGWAAMIMHAGWSLGFWVRLCQGREPPFEGADLLIASSAPGL